LTLYNYAEGKYVDAGCYTATWTAAKDKDSDTPDPAISPCKEEEKK
jgi:hypothetical protein